MSIGEQQKKNMVNIGEWPFFECTLAVAARYRMHAMPCSNSISIGYGCDVCMNVCNAFVHHISEL